jgi:hypothetical protein
MRNLFIALALVLFVGGTAVAQPKGGDKAGKVKVYDFSGDTIEGDLVKPRARPSMPVTSRSTRL